MWLLWLRFRPTRSRQTVPGKRSIARGRLLVIAGSQPRCISDGDERAVEERVVTWVGEQEKRGPCGRVAVGLRGRGEMVAPRAGP